MIKRYIHIFSIVIVLISLYFLNILKIENMIYISGVLVCLKACIDICLHRPTQQKKAPPHRQQQLVRLMTPICDDCHRYAEKLYIYEHRRKHIAPRALCPRCHSIRQYVYGRGDRHRKNSGRSLPV
jgi:hypothetical protein